MDLYRHDSFPRLKEPQAVIPNGATAAIAGKGSAKKKKMKKAKHDLPLGRESG